MCKNLLYKGIADFKYQLKRYHFFANPYYIEKLQIFDTTYKNRVRFTQMYYIS